MWGDVEDAIESFEINSGTKSKHRTRKPQLRPEYVWYWQHYHFLSEGRQSGHMMMQPLPISEILAYSEMVGIRSHSLRLTFLKVVRAMDSAYRNWSLSKMKQSETKPK